MSECVQLNIFSPSTVTLPYPQQATYVYYGSCSIIVGPCLCRRMFTLVLTQQRIHITPICLLKW